MSQNKRRIERIMSRVVQTGLGTSEANIVLHTAEDSKTLVRILMRAKAYATGDIATPVRGEWLLAVAPNGTGVTAAASTSQDLDNPVPLQEIARGPMVWCHNATGDYAFMDTVELDTKAMRKLKENDVIELSLISNTASSLYFTAVVYLWFKE